MDHMTPYKHMSETKSHHKVLKVNEYEHLTLGSQ